MGCLPDDTKNKRPTSALSQMQNHNIFNNITINFVLCTLASSVQVDVSVSVSILMNMT